MPSLWLSRNRAGLLFALICAFVMTAIFFWHFKAAAQSASVQTGQRTRTSQKPDLAQSNQPDLSSPKKFVEGELLVKFSRSSSSKTSRLAHKQVGARLLREFPFVGWQHVRLPQGMSVAEGLARYSKLPGVVAVQPDYIYQLAATPDDTRFSEQYGLQNIQAPAAWDITTGSEQVVVAVIDTGIFYTHEDLSANMWRNPGETGLDANGNDKATNGIDDDGDGYVDDVYGIDTFNHDSDPLDDRGHGTHCAGIIGAVGNNGKGVAGVNWHVRLMALKFLARDGSGSSDGAIAALDYVLMMKNRGVNVRLTNNSYGGDDDPALKDAMDLVGNAGILNVCAAGNQGANTDSSPFYPASYNSPGIISVAASDQNDNPASFTNYGATSVDLAAPGVGILSTVSDGPMYDYLSGTSMAGPYVAGAAALLLAHNDTLSAASLKATLMNTVDVLPQWANKVGSGGRLNVARALQNATICTTALSPTEQPFPASGGDGSINVSSQNNCGWSASSNVNWITIASGTQVGSGNGLVSFTVASNNSGLSRTGTISIGGQSFNVSQESDPAVQLLSPVNGDTYPALKEISLAATARSNNSTIVRVDFYAGEMLIATASASPYQATWTPKTPGTYIIKAIATDALGRTATSNTATINVVPSATISGRLTDNTGSPLAHWPIRLDGPQSASPTSSETDAAGYYQFSNLLQGYSYTVTPTGSGYNYTPPDWTTNSLSSNQTVNFVGTPASCSYTLSPASRNFSASGGADNLTINTLQGCGWKVRNNPPWVKLSDSDGYGSAIVSFFVSPNTSTSARAASLDIGGQTFNISQDAAPPSCTYSVSPTDESFSMSGGDGTISVTTSGGCNWEAVSQSSWITLTGGESGSGSGVVTYHVSTNDGDYRAGTLVVAGQTINIDQKGASIAPPGSMDDSPATSSASYFLRQPFEQLFALNTVQSFR